MMQHFLPSVLSKSWKIFKEIGVGILGYFITVPWNKMGSGFSLQRSIY